MRKHVARIKSVWPKDEKVESICIRKAYCGVSLSNPNYYGARLNAIVDFLLSNFEESLVITGGYLYRYHYRLFCLDDDTALKLAMEKETGFINNELKSVLDGLNSTDKKNLQSYAGVIYTKQKISKKT